jgi:hypothetical protein
MVKIQNLRMKQRDFNMRLRKAGNSFNLRRNRVKIAVMS